MKKNYSRFEGEAKAIIEFIIEGNNKLQAAEEFGVSEFTIDRRIQRLGYTFEEIAKIRDKRLSKKVKE